MGLMGLMGTLLSTPWMARQEAQTGNTSKKSVGKAVHLLQVCSTLPYLNNLKSTETAVATALSWFASGRSECCCMLTGGTLELLVDEIWLVVLALVCSQVGELRKPRPYRGESAQSTRMQRRWRLEQLAEVLRRWLLSSSAGSTCSAVRGTCRKEPAAQEGGVGGKTGKGQEPPRRLTCCLSEKDFPTLSGL